MARPPEPKIPTLGTCEQLISNAIRVITSVQTEILARKDDLSNRNLLKKSDSKAWNGLVEFEAKAVKQLSVLQASVRSGNVYREDVSARVKEIAGELYANIHAACYSPSLIKHQSFFTGLLDGFCRAFHLGDRFASKSSQVLGSADKMVGWVAGHTSITDKEQKTLELRLLQPQKP